MTSRPTYHDDATSDIAEAMAWYRSKKAGLDEQFLAAVLECEAVIARFPKGAPLVLKHFRQLPLSGFPYVLLYGVWRDEIIIYRVFHTSQHPKKKFKKRK